MRRLACRPEAIICIGETETQRENGHALSVCTSQLQLCIPEGANPQSTAIAYEPVWAIGTGKTPTSAQIVEVHTLIRDHLTARFGEAGREMRILYGGSVKPSNARGNPGAKGRQRRAGGRRKPEGCGLPAHHSRFGERRVAARYASLTDRVAILSIGDVLRFSE